MYRKRIGIPGDHRCRNHRHKASQKRMGSPRPVLHGLRRLADELHLRSPSHERREATLRPPCRLDHRSSSGRRAQPLKIRQKLLSPHDKLSNHIKELVQGVIEGETQVLAASMTMEEVFKGTKDFKQEVFEKVQLELKQFGLLIYNANVKQLVDVPGHEYFSYLEAANQAKVDVEEAKMKGEIGSKLREGQTLQNAAKIDAETNIISTQRYGEGKKEEFRVKTEVKVYENEREADVAAANSELAKKKAGWAKEAQLAEMEAAKAVALRDVELQREVERMNAMTRTEKLKVEFLSKASVEYETQVSC